MEISCLWGIAIPLAAVAAFFFNFPVPLVFLCMKTDEITKAVIGISGGKDSLTLLYALHGLKRFYPKKFEIHAVTVDLGFKNLDLDKIKEICDHTL